MGSITCGGNDNTSMINAFRSADPRAAVHAAYTVLRPMYSVLCTEHNGRQG